MRLVASAVCALLVAVICMFGIRWLQASPAQGKENLAVLKGRVAMPGGPCRGSGRASTFMLLVNVAGTYQLHRFACDETVRAAAVGGTEVVFGIEAVTRGSQDAWLIRTAQVDGRDLFQPRSLLGPPTAGEIFFALWVGVLLFLVVGVIAVPGQPPSRAASRSNRKRR